MIRFEQEDDGPDLYLIYTPENNDGGWLKHQLDTTGKASISGKIFHVSKERLITEEDQEDIPDEEEFTFYIGIVSAGYYIIDPEVLGIKYDLGIHGGIQLERKIFAAVRNISIFRSFNSFGLKSMTIGGGDEDSLPEETFKQLLQAFPNSYELTRYAKARISSIVRNHLPIQEDEEAKYEKYLNKKESHLGTEPLKTLAPYESDKFNGLVSKIETMLGDAKAYNEDQWQKEILEVVVLLFPKYIKAFREGPVNDSWAHTTRRVDFLLVDASGYIDVIEIKKPSEGHTVTPNDYRGNHVPQRALVGTIMQVEKYLYHFNRWGKAGEDKLTKKYGDELPKDFEIKIVNPSGLIIMGRDDGLTEAQRNDFEVIRRKYRNVVDIITYDDLLRRLKVIRNQYNARMEA